MDYIIEAGADDMEDQEESFQVTCSPENFDTVAEFFEAKKIHREHSEINNIPRDTVEITDLTTARAVMRLVDTLDEHEDIQQVSSNVNIPDEIMEQLENE